jgi:hypothetical protein
LRWATIAGALKDIRPLSCLFSMVYDEVALSFVRRVSQAEKLW